MADKFRADVERLTEAIESNKQDAADIITDLEAQRDEAVARVETYHGAEIFAEQKAGRDTHDLVACDTCIFLASLSTVTGPAVGATLAITQPTPCEQVSVPSYPTGLGFFYICDTHVKPWGECEVKAG